MISILFGKVVDKDLGSVVVDVGGVGYGVFVTSEDLGHLEIDSMRRLYIFEYIRDQAYDLFGFIDIKTKQLFEQLINVNGVGPRMALGVLSIGSTEQVRSAIANGDVNYLKRAQGVGKRVAERIVVDLKDKVGLASSDVATGFLHEGQESEDEAIQALLQLGFSPADANKALSGVARDVSTEERVRLALRGTK